MHRIFTHRWFGGKSGSRRGMTLIELVVGMMVVGTAAVGTTIAVFNAYGQLQRQRHRMVANQLMRAEIEYWQGRVHTAFPTVHQMNNAITHPVVIDKRDPGDRYDDILGEVTREPIREHVLVATSTQLQYYWEIPVKIVYTEPTWVLGEPDVEVEYHLVGYWLESEPTNHMGEE